MNISPNMSVEQIMDRIRQRVRFRKQEGNGPGMVSEAIPSAPLPESISLYDLAELRRNAAANNLLWDKVGTLNPRPPGWHNHLLQLLKRTIRRLLTWYTRPLQEFHGSVTRCLNETTRALENLQTGVLTFGHRLQGAEQQARNLQANQQESLQALRECIDNQHKNLVTAVTERFNRFDEILAGDKQDKEDTDRQLQRIQTELEASQVAITEERGKLQQQLGEQFQEKLREQLNALQAELGAQIEDTRKQAFSLLDSAEGPRAKEGLRFNDPIMVSYNEKGQPSWWGTHERIVEKAWVLRHLTVLPRKARILDVGCAESILPIELASGGFQVTGLDIQPYPLQHPNFVFLRGNICNSQLAANTYHAVIALSTIEHIGLGWYGDEQGEALDQVAMREIYRLLRPGGRLLITVPFGQRALTPLHRVYDGQSLRALLRRFQMEKVSFGIKVDEKTWISPVTEADAAGRRHDPATYFPSAVAMALCIKPRKR